MKTIYHQRDNRRRRKKMLVTTGVLGAVLVVTITLNLVRPNLFSPVVHAIGRPIFEARGGILGNARTFFEYLQFKKTLISENSSLKDARVLYEAVKLERDYFKKENAELLKLTDSGTTTPKLTPARILLKPGFSPYDTIVVARGAEDGVRVGQYALVSDDTVIGTISDVYKHSSVITLFSSPEKETRVFVGAGSIQALAVGKGGGTYDIKLPRNTNVAEGDVVVLASSTPKILGAVQHVAVSPSDTFERVLFKSPVDIAEVTYVLIEN